MGKGKLWETDDGKHLEASEQPVAHGLQRGVRENAIRDDDGGASGLRFQKMPDTFKEQDFALLLCERRGFAFGVGLVEEPEVVLERRDVHILCGYAEGWVGQDEIEPHRLEARIAGGEGGDGFDGVAGGDVGVAVVVNDRKR